MQRIVLGLVVCLTATATMQAMEPADAGQPLALAMKDRVQKELGLSETEVAAVKKLHVRAEKGELTTAEAKKQLSKALSEKQLTRLKEISYQVLGGAALIDPDVQGKLSLSRTQARKISEIWKNEELNLQMVLRVARFRSPEARRAFILSNRKQAGDKLLEVLQDEQKTTLKKLQGKPIDIKGLDR